MRKDPRKSFNSQYRPSNQTYRERYGNEKGVYTKPLGEKETNQRIIMNIGIDVSGSTQELWGEMTDCFNSIMMRSFQQKVEEYRKVLRIGAVVFSEKIVPIWNGFEDIATVTGSNGSKSRKLTIDIIKQADNGKTALHQTMIQCLKYSATAANYLDSQREMPGNPAKIKICILTDGANNMDPLNAEAVRKITSTITNRRQIQLVLAYFKTEYGLSFDEFQVMTKNTGFDDEPYYFNQIGGNKEKRARNFRRFFEIVTGQTSSFIG